MNPARTAREGSAYRFVAIGLLASICLTGCKNKDVFTLSVIMAGDGGGTVSSAPTSGRSAPVDPAFFVGGSIPTGTRGTICRSSCSISYVSGSRVMLTALADSDSTFVEWGGDCAGNEGGRSVFETVDRNLSCTVTFQVRTFDLHVTINGPGSGAVTSIPAGIDCDSTCLAAFKSGQSVQLQAKAGPASVFAGWSGDCSGSSSSTTVAIDANKGCGAIFSPKTATLTVRTAGDGSGTVISDPAGVDCGTACSNAFGFGSSVTLNARSDPDSIFMYWTGSCSGTDPSVTITLNGDGECFARFDTMTTAGALVIATKPADNTQPPPPPQGTGQRTPACGSLTLDCVSTPPDPNATQLSLVRYTAAGYVQTYTSGVPFVIPSTAPAVTSADRGCGGTAFRNKGYDRDARLLFIEFESGSGNTLCGYTVDPIRGTIGFAFSTLPGATNVTCIPGPCLSTSLGNVIGIDLVNHVIIFSSGVAYPYNQSGLTGKVLAFNVTVPSGFSIQKMSPRNNLIWYGTSNNGITLNGACLYTYSSGIGYSNASPGACQPFPAPTQPFSDFIGEDAARGLLVARSAVNACSGAATIAYAFAYEPSTGILGNPGSPAQRVLGPCVDPVSDPADVAGGVDVVDRLFFGARPVSGVTITPYPYTDTGALPAPLSSKATAQAIGRAAMDSINHLLFVLTGAGGSIARIISYPYGASGLGTSVQRDVNLPDSTPAGVVPLFAVVN
jgi:hypothetical protein